MKYQLLLSGLLLIFVTHTFAASFDCNKARTKTEKEICSNKELSDLDDKLQNLYKQALAIVPYKEELKKQQLNWLKKREKRVLEFSYQERIMELTSTIKAHEFARLRAKEQSLPATDDRLAALIKKRFLTPEEDSELLILTAQQRKMDTEGYFYSSASGKNDLKLCSAMLEDIQQGRKFEIVPPVARTDDYNDPSLQRYFDTCSAYTPPYKEVYYTVTDPRLTISEMTDDEIESEAIPGVSIGATVHYALLDYRLYLVDFDNNPKNGKEYVFYRGGKLSKGSGSETGSADFVVMDRKSCKQRATESLANQNINFRTGEAEGYNGMFSYSGKYYMYTISYSKKENFRDLNIYGYDRKSTRGLCVTRDSRN
ncbi:lysozyme inhibitor LprI family protein [Pelotalea chapellei]|uniref:DUF1311 domain-containing protein n=1 Tax=Pelotalea chapellei TaxID=44671 RepID=A0ABS5UDC0_9BACT|nr:lysozyme inhibitor LprI family protein [Pelotalea chapellei]MBT1073633.1 DUF1311 domain-containing protein [Pelotalea chapellei]